MLIDQSIKRVRDFRRTRGLSILGMAKVAGLNESTIRNMDGVGWSPTADTLRRLEAVIPPDFFPDSPDTAKPP